MSKDGDNIERLEDYHFDGEEQKIATHVAISVELHRSLTAFFQQNQNLTWAESNPFVVGLMQGKPVAFEETE